jgi:enoyl-CoA hydratase/carnithine racemase
MTVKHRGGGDAGGIAVETRGHVRLIGLNRAEKYNGFTPKMFAELAEAYTDFENDPEMRVAVLYGEGKHFTAGLDLNSMGHLDGDFFPPGRIDPLSLRPPLRTKPVVAAVHGVCFTIGIELMLAADIAIAAENTRFSQLEVKRGLAAFGGATTRMVERAGWQRAMKHLLTGCEFSAEEAHACGYVTELTEPGTQLTRALLYAEDIAAQAPLAVRDTLKLARIANRQGPDAAVAEFRNVVESLQATDDFEEGKLSFLERRDAEFKGR